MFPSPLPPRRATARSASRFLTAILVTAFVAALVLASGGWAWATSRMTPAAVMLSGGDTTVVWGPDTMRTLNGHHQTFVEAIGIAAQAGKQYAVRLTRIGSGNLSEATVTFNHRTIASKSDFVGTGTTITLPVKLTGADTVTVDVKGDNGVGLVVAFVSTTDATVVVFAQTFTTSDNNGNDSNSNSNSNSSSDSGSASVTTVQFLRPSTVGQPAYLYVNAVRPTGFNPASADIYLNGVRIIDHGDGGFAREVTSLAVPVTLVPGTNTLRVVERGKSPTRFSLEIRATTTVRPVLTITSPAPNAITKNTSIVVTGTVTDATTVTVTVNGVVAALGAGHSYSATIPLLNEGSNPITVHAENAAGLAADSVRIVTRDTHPPVLLVTAPTDLLLTNSDSVTVSGSVSDATAVRLTVQGVPLTGGSGGAFSARVALAEGANFIIVLATDAAGNITSILRRVNRDKTPPVLAVTSPANGTTTTDATIPVNGTVQDANTVSLTVNGNPVMIGQNGVFTTSVSLQTGVNLITVVATDGATNTVTVTRSVTRTANTGPSPMTEVLPADPSVNPPALNYTTGAPTALATAFLYSGANPIQIGVQAGAIDSVRVGVLRGRVADRNGQAIQGVTVTVAGHPELGHTATRANGIWDLAVNAGAVVTVQFAKAGYLSAQRSPSLQWQELHGIADVVLVPLSADVTPITFTQPIEVARGPVQSDASGSRRQRAFFRQGTQATLVLPNGSTQSSATLHIRLTEFTVGSSGPKAMPADLPPASAYTYAFDIASDEAIAAGAIRMNFSQPVSFYSENFLGFAVGTRVPVASYDAVTSTWKGEPSGRVIKVLGVSGGTATIDTDGDGIADATTLLDSLGIDAAERAALATEFTAGATLWRFSATHASEYDLNWALPGNDPDDDSDDPTNGTRTNHPGCRSGCVIEVENQVLRDNLPVVGAPFMLSYASARAAGYRAASVLRIPVTNARPIDPRFTQFGIEVQIGGRVFRQTFAPDTNLSTSLVWDGLDVYGRPVDGAVATVIRTGSTLAEYLVPPEDRMGFAVACTVQLGGAFCQPTAVQGREPIAVRNQSFLVPMSRPSQHTADVAGWDVSVHHAYDPVSHTLLLGNGEQVEATGIVDIGRSRFGGNGSAISSGDGGLALNAGIVHVGAIVAGPDGSMYVADSLGHNVRRIAPNGTISTVAGTGSAGSGAPGGLATATAINQPSGLVLDPSGRLYISDAGNARVLRVEINGLVTLIAGGNGIGDSGDDSLAINASLTSPGPLAFRRGGSLLILDAGIGRVREVTPDGSIHAFAGAAQGNACNGGTGIAARGACPIYRAMAVLPDGRVAVSTNNQLHMVDGGGVLTVFGGLTPQGTCGAHDSQSGLQAANVGFCIQNLAVDLNGSLFTTELNSQLVRKIDPAGTVSQLRFCTAEQPIASAIVEFRSPIAYVVIVAGACNYVTAGNDGALYTAGDKMLERLDTGLPGFTNAAFRIPAADGGEVYEFNSSGTHLRTFDGLTNATLLTFGYDGQGRLLTITDADSNVTTITRNGAGVATAIVSPYGEQTTLTLNGAGRLANVVNPAGEVTAVTYQTNGLLATRVSPTSAVTRFTFDTLGYLINEQNEIGGFQRLSRHATSLADTIGVTDALGRTTTSTIATARQTGTETHTSVDAAGLRTLSTQTASNQSAVTGPDGTVLSEQTSTDPRWGGQVRVTDFVGMRLPSANAATISFGRRVQLTNPLDPTTVVKQTDSLVVAGQTFRGVFDAATRIFTTTSPEGRSSSLALDVKGRVTQVATAGLAPITYIYDARGRQASVTQGDRTETYTYNATGRIATITDPLNRVTTFSYDAAGRVTSEVLPGGRTVAFAYDSSGRVTSLTPPGKPAHTFAYNGADLPTGYQAPAVTGSTGATSYSYSSQKELLALTRPDTQQIVVGYDAAGRPSTVTTAEGVNAIGYSTTTGQVTSLDAPHGVGQQMRYDGALPTGTTWTGPVTGAVDFTYDNALRLRGIAVNGNGIAGPSYDRDGLPVTNGFLSMSYRPDNGMLQQLLAAGHTGTWTYDSLGQVATYAVVGLDTVFRANYTYDKLGRIIVLSERIQADTATYAYAYDAAGRLAQVQKSGSVVAAYDYDLNGNRTRATYPSQTVVASYDNQDRLLTSGINTYAYTGNGELKLKVAGTDSTKYRYDALGNLRDVWLSNGNHIEYVIDAQQRRIGRKVNGTLVQGWLYQSQLAIAAEVDATGNVVKEFEYATHGNVPDWMRANGNAYRLVTDHLGSVRLVIDANGNVVQRIDYDAYGRVVTNTNPGFQPFGFAGGLLDDLTGLTRFGARDFDAVGGGWSTKDPSGLTAGSNAYEYVNSNPVSLRDPSGEIPIFIVLVGVGGLYHGAIMAINEYQNCRQGFGHLAGAFGRGFVSGAVGTLAGLWAGVASENPLAVGFAGGAITSGVDQLFETGTVNIRATLIGATIGAATEGIGRSAVRLQGPRPNVWVPRAATRWGPNAARLAGRQAVGSSLDAIADRASHAVRQTPCGCN